MRLTTVSPTQAFLELFSLNLSKSQVNYLISLKETVLFKISKFQINSINIYGAYCVLGTILHAKTTKQIKREKKKDKTASLQGVNIFKTRIWGFPGGPVVKTLCFQYKR